MPSSILRSPCFGRLVGWALAGGKWPCYLGLLIPPWGLLTPNSPLTSHLDEEEGWTCIVHCASL